MTNYHMHGLRHVRKLLTDDTARTVACSIAARLDTATPFYIEPRKRRCTAVQLSYNAFRTIYGGMVKPHYMNNEVNLRSVHIKKREKTYLRWEKVPVRHTGGYRHKKALPPYYSCMAMQCHYLFANYICFI